MATRAAGAKLELQLHPGDEYVGSWEPESLQVLSYVKLSKASQALNIDPSYISWHSSSAVGLCPVLQRGEKKVALGSEEIVTYLKEQGFNTDGHLKDYQQAEVVAYAALLKDRILPAILYSRWLDSQNYVEVTRHWYSQFLYFPFSLFFLSWSHRAVQHRLMTSAPSKCTEEQRGVELLAKAEECINLLSARLGTDSYFSGERPSSLDALVFGYMEVLLQCPLPSNNSLHRTVHSCVNLKSFCDRIRGSCFPDKKQRSASSTSSTVRKSAPSTLWKDPMLWAWVGVATLLLGVQGVRVGLFSRVGAWVASHRYTQKEEETYEDF